MEKQKRKKGKTRERMKSDPREKEKIDSKKENGWIEGRKEGMTKLTEGNKETS